MSRRKKTHQSVQLLHLFVSPKTCVAQWRDAANAEAKIALLYSSKWIVLAYLLGPICMWLWVISCMFLCLHAFLFEAWSNSVLDLHSLTQLLATVQPCKVVGLCFWWSTEFLQYCQCEAHNYITSPQSTLWDSIVDANRWFHPSLPVSGNIVRSPENQPWNLPV